MIDRSGGTLFSDPAKRCFDVVLSGVLLLLLSPILAMIAVSILILTGKPVFYLGKRVGRYGRVFGIVKFRTMSVDAERSGTTTALDDPRITGIGRFLRRTKLDEIPQLYNIMKGDMSFVGPRPEVKEHTDAYTEEEKLILTVLPGLTDYSSIRFISLDEALGSDNPHQVYLSVVRAEKNRLRLKYVRERSFVTDLRIIGLTVRALLKKILGIAL